MSIRTIDELSDALARELVWRKKELSNLKYYIDIAQLEPARRTVLGRCGVALLYAHWEGFVKRAGRYFLEFVAMQRLRNDQLHPSLLTLSMRSRVNIAPNTRKASDFGKVTEFFLTDMTRRAAIPFKQAIDTESNLSSTVLREITWCLGIDYSPYETKEKFIDSHLLARRNHIAHGEYIEVNPRDYEDMRATVIEMMTTLKTQIENSATLRGYLARSD